MRFKNHASVLITFMLLGLLEVETWKYDIIDKDYYTNRILTVTTILIEPYTMLKLTNETSVSSLNDLYEGYIVDLVEAIADIIGFRYRLVPVWDGEFGYRQADEQWDGMIGELIRREADIASGPIYITKQRQHVVDFTQPFMRVEASLLVSRRRIAEKKVYHSAEELFSQSTFALGTLNRGLIHRAFRNSNHSLFKAMYDSMQSRPAVSFTKTNEEGIERVRSDNFAFILPNKIAEYVSRKTPCDLMAVDNFLLYEGFALAVPKGSAILPLLNKAIDQLEKQGELKKLYRKWWIDKTQCNSIHPEKVFSLRSAGNGSENLRTRGLHLQITNLFVICLLLSCQLPAVV